MHTPLDLAARRYIDVMQNHNTQHEAPDSGEDGGNLLGAFKAAAATVRDKAFGLFRSEEKLLEQALAFRAEYMEARAKRPLPDESRHQKAEAMITRLDDVMANPERYADPASEESLARIGIDGSRQAAECLREWKGEFDDGSK